MGEARQREMPELPAGLDRRTRHDLHQQTEAAKVLREHLADMLGAEDANDEDLIRDSVEGETTLHEAIERAAALVLQTETQITGLKAIIDKLTQRKQRYEARVRNVKTALALAMAMGELKTLELPFVTLSRRAKTRGLIVQDESAIPPDYFVTPDPKLDRKTLTAALKDGVEVPGATLDNGGETIACRWI